MNPSSSYKLNQLLLNDLIHAKPLQEVFEHMKTQLQINVFLMDLYGQILMYAAEDSVDQYFQGFYHNATTFICYAPCPETDPTDFQSRLFQANGPFYLPSSKSSGYHNLFIPIQKDGFPSWILILKYMDPTLTASIQDAVPHMIRLCQQMLASPDFLVQSIKNTTRVEQMIARELLLYENSKFDTAENNHAFVIQYATSKKQNIVSASLEPPFAIAASSLRSPSRMPQDYSYAFYHMCRRFPDSFSIVRQNVMLTIFCHYSAEIHKTLEELSYQEQLHIAISDPFYSLKDRLAFRSQARSVLSYGISHAPHKYIHMYMDYYQALIFETAAKETSLPVLLLSDICMLAQHDLNNNTDYLRTLQQYVDSGNSYTEASQKLFINRGTLKYRLEKISHILSVDFEDAHTAETLSVAISVYDRYMSSSGFTGASGFSAVDPAEK